MRKYFIFSLLFLLFAPLFASSQETVTITTYYPSPVGVYQSLRLFPSTQAAQPACVAADPNAPLGTIYYNNANNQLQLCTPTGWGSVGGLWTLAGIAPNQIIYPNNTTDWRVGIGTTDPSLDNRVNSVFTVISTASNPTGITLGTSSAQPSFAVNPNNTGSWTIQDYVNNTWNTDMSASGGIVTFNRFVIQKRTSNPPSPQEGELWFIQ